MNFEDAPTENGDEMEEVPAEEGEDNSVESMNLQEIQEEVTKITGQLELIGDIDTETASEEDLQKYFSIAEQKVEDLQGYLDKVQEVVDGSTTAGKKVLDSIMKVASVAAKVIMVFKPDAFGSNLKVAKDISAPTFEKQAAPYKEAAKEIQAVLQDTVSASRELNDALLLAGGAEYVQNKDGSESFTVTPDQIEDAREEMEENLSNRE